MKRRILIALLGLGTIGGFAAGAASLSCRAQHRRAHFERHVASLCVDAARKSDADHGKSRSSAGLDADEHRAPEQ
jgi:hypothetical protein